MRSHEKWSARTGHDIKEHRDDPLADFVPLPQSGLTATVTDLHAHDRSQRWTTAIERRQARELASDHHRIRAQFQELFAAQLADALGGAA